MIKPISDNIRIIPSSKPTSLERSIEKQTHINPSPVVVKKFANGETYINIQEDMRNKDVYLMPTVGKEVNDSLMETYLKADASKRMGAHRIIAVMPNLPYARQERKTESGEPISADLGLALLEASGVNEVITVDLHSPAIQGFSKNMKVTELSSLKAMTDYLNKEVLKPDEDYVVVSPDLGGAKRVDKLAKELKCDKALIHKGRKEHNQATAEFLIGDVKDKNCIIYDDIIDTAGTITEAVNLLHDKGAKKIYVLASHGLFNSPAIDRLQKLPLESIIVTNSEMKPNYNKVKQVDIAPQIVGAMLDITG